MRINSTNLNRISLSVDGKTPEDIIDHISSTGNVLLDAGNVFIHLIWAIVVAIINRHTKLKDRVTALENEIEALKGIAGVKGSFQEALNAKESALKNISNSIDKNQSAAQTEKTAQDDTNGLRSDSAGDYKLILKQSDIAQTEKTAETGAGQNAAAQAEKTNTPDAEQKPQTTEAGAEQGAAAQAEKTNTPDAEQKPQTTEAGAEQGAAAGSDEEKKS